MKTIKIILIVLAMFVATVAIQYAAYYAFGGSTDDPIEAVDTDDILENEEKEISGLLPYHIFKSYTKIGMHNDNGEYITEIIDPVTNMVTPIYAYTVYMCWCDSLGKRDIYSLGLSEGAKIAGATEERYPDKTIYRYKDFYAEFPYGKDYIDSMGVVIDSIRNFFEKNVYIKTVPLVDPKIKPYTLLK